MAEENNLKKEIEAILFAAGRMVELDEIARLCKEDKSRVEPLLKELKSDYERSDSPMFLIQEGNGWKMTVREKYLGVVKDVSPHTELNKALLETLAIVAWKQPVMQADVVRIRGSTTYEHISALVEMGFITKIKHGRSYVLKPSTRFFDYFDLPSKEAVREVFKDIELSDSEKRKQLGEKFGDPQKKMDEIAVTGSSENVEVYNSAENMKVPLEKAEEDMETEKFGKLEIYEEKEEKDSGNQEKTDEEQDDDQDNENEKEQSEEYNSEESEKIEKKDEESGEEKEKETEDDKEHEKKDYDDIADRIRTISDKKKSLPKELKEFADIKDEEEKEEKSSEEQEEDSEEENG